MFRIRFLLVGIVLLGLAGGASAEILQLEYKWGPIVVGTGTQSAYYLNDSVVAGNVIGARISYGPYEQSRDGTVINELSTSPTATAKSAVRVGDYFYFSGNEGGMYRTQVSNTATPWSTFSQVTVTNEDKLETIVTDGTYIYGSSTAEGDQIRAFSVDPGTGALTQIWSTSGIAGRVRGLDWHESGYLYAVDGGGPAENAVGNTAQMYAIDAAIGQTFDMGAVTFNGRQYQTIREGNRVFVFDSYTGAVAPSGQVYIYHLATDTSLVSTTPAAVFDPDEIGRIFGAAIDGNFVWLAGVSGQTYGFRLVPEPSTLLLLTVGGLGLLLRRRRRRS